MTNKFKARRNFLREYAIITAITLVGYFVRWFSGQFSPDFNFILLFTSFILISTTWEFLNWINHLLNQKLPYERNITLRIAVQLILGTLYALTARLLIFLFGEPLLNFPLDKLFLVSTWLLYVFAVAIVNSIFIVTFFINRWKDSILEAERLEKEKAWVQFDNLKNQLNPHFLFNALSSLNSLIQEDQKLASDFLQHLSKIYRYILQNKDKSLVSLQTELDFIRNYSFLAETRFQNSLKIEFHLPAPLPDKEIVPVTLQVLIENALKHNRIDDQNPLQIKIQITGNYIEVTNNYQPRKIVESSNKQGLENLKSLYRFFSKLPVEILQTESYFSVKVPLL